MAGHYAEWCHDPRVRHVTPRALEFDEQWSFVKKAEALRRRGAARQQRAAFSTSIRESDAA